jgi:hypothetical protein
MKQDDQRSQHIDTFQLVEGHGSPPSNPQEQKKAFLWRRRMKLEFEVQGLIVRIASLVQEWQLLHGQKAASGNEVSTIASQLLLAGWLESQQHPDGMPHPSVRDHLAQEASRIQQDMVRCSMDIASAKAQIMRLDFELSLL